jgi:hypothetical protein
MGKSGSFAQTGIITMLIQKNDKGTIGPLGNIISPM